MKITLAAILPRAARTKSEPTDRLLADYITRTARTIPCESQTFATEADLLEALDPKSSAKSAQHPTRTRAFAILLDSRGQQLTSEQFAARIIRLRDEGTQRLVLAIGPADGWSAPACTRADLLLSLGPLTLPHQLARVILAEQLYRATTILTGHPYHSGH